MKTIKYIFASMLSLFVAAGFTACSDDDNYSVGQESPGAYFPENQPSSVRALNTTTVYEGVEVMRTSASAPSTYNVTVNIYPQTDAISIPSSVSFSGNDLKTILPITYDPDAIDTAETYDIQLDLENASGYGESSYSFSFVVGSPLETVAWDGSLPEGQSADGTVWPAVEGRATGTGNYLYDCLAWGDDPGLPVYKQYDPNNPHSYDIIVEHWCYDVPLTINVPDDRVRNEYGELIVRVPVTDTGYDYGDYGRMYMSDLETYSGEGTYADWSSFDAESGVFYLATIYYVSAGILAYTGDSYGDGYDHIQLDGYPDYTASVEYLGLYINPDEENYAIGQFTTGEDVASAKAALVETSDASTALSYIIQGAEDVVDVTPGTDVRSLFRVYTSGTYTLAIVTYDSSNEVQGYATTVVDIDLGGKESDAADWTSLGDDGLFVDGWILAAFSSIDPTSWAWNVTISQNKQNPNLYRIEAPFASSDYLLNYYSYNECTKKRNIEFTIDGDYIEMLPQLCGFAYSGFGIDEEFVVMNYEGYFASQFIDEGEEYTADEILAVCEYYEHDKTEYDAEEGLIEIPESPFCFATQFGAYYWTQQSGEKIVCPSYIVFPGASEQARAKVRAKAIAKPKVSGLAKTIKMRKGIKAVKSTANAVKVAKATKARTAKAAKGGKKQLRLMTPTTSTITSVSSKHVNVRKH